MNKLVRIEANGKRIYAEEGEFLIHALKRAGIKVPTLCYMEDLLPSGACRMCVVEIEGIQGLIPSCAYPVTNNLVVRTNTPKVIQARKTIVDLLQANHPDDCLYCVRSGTCDLQKLSTGMGIMERRFVGEKSEFNIDLSSPSIVREPSKCILCGKCVRVCEEVMSVGAIDFINRGSKTFVGPAFNEGRNISSCIACGQCIKVCPTASIREQNNIDDVLGAILDPNKTVVVQIAPAVSVTIGEEFGFKQGIDIEGKLIAALRELGFDRVFKTDFSADLTIMEEASELIQRLTTGGTLPMMTSCSPGWVKFVEQFYPDFIGNLSTCKSPQEMLGAILKSYWAQQNNINPKDIYSVAIMPCTAKKFEANRLELMTERLPDIDTVLTTRELASMIKMMGIDFDALIDNDIPDNPFGERSSAGKMFAVTGGVMEAAMRTAHYLLTGKNLNTTQMKEVRGLNGRKEVTVKIGKHELKCAVVSGLANARQLLDEIRSGAIELDFIEVMTCPGGCINGGGQPFHISAETLKSRMKAIYRIDREETIRTSYSNKSVKKLYDDFLGEPLSELSHELLHTHYVERDVLK